MWINKNYGSGKPTTRSYLKKKENKVALTTILALVSFFASVIFLPLCAYFVGEIKELRRQNTERQAEIARIREAFATREHLDQTERRITEYINTRFDDLSDKMDRVTDLMQMLVAGLQTQKLQK